MTMEINKDSIKELMNLGKSLKTMAGQGASLSEDDINKKAIKDLGIGQSTFRDLADMGNKLRALKEVSEILSKLGIRKDLVEEGLKLATSLTGIASKGQESLEKENSASLKDIGLDKGTFKDMKNLGDGLDQLGDLTKMIPGLDGGASSQGLMDGVASVLNMLKK